MIRSFANLEHDKARWISTVLSVGLLTLSVIANQEPGVVVTCSNYIMQVSLEKGRFPYLNGSRMHLLYSSCRAWESFTHIYINSSLSGCGTSFDETGDTLVFHNMVQEDAVPIHNVITRQHDFELEFNCSYSRTELLSLHFVPEGIAKIPGQEGFGNFTFRFDVYPSSSYTSPHTSYPVEVALNEYLYLQYSVESSADLVIMAVNCKATKDASFYSSPEYIFIQNGCSRDTSLIHDYNNTRTYQRFKIRAFRFFNNYDSYYFHCELLACHQNSANSRCRRGCLSEFKRKKRDVTEDKVSTSDTYLIKRGPLKITQKKDSGGLSKQSAAVIGGAAAAGGVLLFAIVALAVLFVKYRVARLLLNRNKVGDLYTTEDEQMSRKNAYIQEDDMNEKDHDAEM